MSPSLLSCGALGSASRQRDADTPCLAPPYRERLHPRRPSAALATSFSRAHSRDRQTGIACWADRPIPCPSDLVPDRINSLNMRRLQPRRKNQAVGDAGAVRRPIPFRSGEKAVTDNPMRPCCMTERARSRNEFKSRPQGSHPRPRHCSRTGRRQSCSHRLFIVTRSHWRNRPTHMNSGAPVKKSAACARCSAEFDFLLPGSLLPARR